MKIKVQAQHLQPGDIVGSGEVVDNVVINSIQWPSNKVCISVVRFNKDKTQGATRRTLWGKYTMINVERKADGV